jgi:hypothetical protein
MATLVANNAEAPMSRIELQPGINLLGRAEGNHHIIRHSSVSSRHCEIVIHDGAINVRDLGSTNGTFIDDEPVQQASLAHGQRLRMGGVEFVVEAPEILTAPNGGRLRVTVPKTVSTTETAEALPTAHTAAAAIAAITPVMYEEPSFYRQIPGAFAYPFNKRGMFLLALGAGFFLIIALAGRAALFFRLSFIGLLLQILIFVFTYGYLFAYMQRIISTSAHGEDDVPDFPDITEFWSDILLPFFLFAGTLVVTFAPPIAVAIFMHDSQMFWYAMGITIVLCALYFPMALLAVAVTDNFLALSPHVVIPSIVRVLGPYLVAWLVLAMLAITGAGIKWAMGFVSVPILPAVVVEFVSLYLLFVEMRILGLMFRARRAELGWL